MIPLVFYHTHFITFTTHTLSYTCLSIHFIIFHINPPFKKILSFILTFVFMSSCAASLLPCRAFYYCGKWELLFLAVLGLSIVAAFLVAEHILYSAQASVGASSGLAAPQHGGSSQTRERTHVPSVGRRILNHCTTREVRSFILNTASFAL